MIDTDQCIQMIAVEAQFALAVLHRAIDQGPPLGETPHYLEMDYDDAQGLLLVIGELDRAMKAIVEAYTDLCAKHSIDDSISQADAPH